MNGAGLDGETKRMRKENELSLGCRWGRGRIFISLPQLQYSNEGQEQIKRKRREGGREGGRGKQSIDTLVSQIPDICSSSKKNNQDVPFPGYSKTHQKKTTTIVCNTLLKLLQFIISDPLGVSTTGTAHSSPSQNHTVSGTKEFTQYSIS